MKMTNIEVKNENSKKEFINIPSFVFKDRTLSVLEVMVEYLRDNKKMRFHEIAMIINRDDRTVWTVYRRAKLKRKGLIKGTAETEAVDVKKTISIQRIDDE
jgi:predicted MarR family transcription regulator